jgi:hypothetical protein
MKRYLILAVLMLLCGFVYAGTPQSAVSDAVARGGVFPPGTSVVGVSVDGNSLTVELSAEAAPFGLGDGQVDAMYETVRNALGPWPEITATEVTVAGRPLWYYLPVPPAPTEIEEPRGLRPLVMEPATVSLTHELAGKNVVLHPSHGAYWNESYGYWLESQRTLCGPNPVTNRPPDWAGSTYQPSDYYYWTRGFQWGSFYEDWRTPEEIRFLEAYLQSSGCSVLVSRNLDKNAGDFDYNGYGYPNCSFPLPKWKVASKYHLQDIGAPEAVWNDPAVTTQSDKDIRARPNWADYNMVGKWPLTAEEIDQVKNNTALWGNWISISLHTNAGSQGGERGTEIYWYTTKYLWLQPKAITLANAFQAATVNAIRTEYDGLWAQPVYPYTGTNPPEWPFTWTYVGYTHSAWANRGVRTSNFGEIREALMPAVLMELLFHDDWKFFPDHVFALDRIFQSTAAWGMYEGICNYWAVTPKPRLAASLVSQDSPGLVAPGQSFAAHVTLRNEGQAWCWGDKWVSGLYFPYTVWKLSSPADDPFAPGEGVPIPADAVVYPGDSVTFDLPMTAPTVPGFYTTTWQMRKDDAMGGLFGPVITAKIAVGPLSLKPNCLAAKAEANGVEVSLAGQAVTAVFGDAFYIEELDRSSGIRVYKPDHGLAVGMTAFVQGLMRTSTDGERYVEAATASQTGQGTVSPLFMVNRDLGGGGSGYDPDTAAGQCGLREYRGEVTADLAGMNNTGLLISTTGRVTEDGDGWFYIDDGSHLDDGQGFRGLRVLGEPPGGYPSAEGMYLRLTGISSCFRAGDSLYRLLLPTDMQVIEPPPGSP